MPEANLTHRLLTWFVSPQQAEAIQGDLREEYGRHGWRYAVQVTQVLLALFVHHLRQTPSPVFILCIACLLLLKILEMLGLFVMLFVLEFNTAVLGVMAASLTVALLASYLAAYSCLRWLPGFGRPQVAITALLLLVYAGVNVILIMTLGRDGPMGIAAAAGRLMLFETLFHIFPIVFAGYRFGKTVQDSEAGLSGRHSG